MRYAIGIPTYRRTGTIQKATLAFLKRHSVPRESITLFVADEEEAEQYRENVQRELYGEIVVGVPGIGPQRNFMQTWYPEGTRLLSIDDDIYDVVERVDAKHTRPIPSLTSLLDLGFAAAEKARTGLWGVYPVHNPYFMKPKVTTDLRYIIGYFMGIVVSHDAALTRTVEDKEDFEASILYYIKYGSVVRLNWITAKTNCYKEPGGMQETRTEQRVEAHARVLLEKYPLFCEYNPRRKTHFEIRLRDKSR